MGSALSLVTQFCVSGEDVPENIGMAMLARCLISAKGMGKKETNLEYAGIVDRVLNRELASVYTYQWKWFVVHLPSLTSSLWNTFDLHGKEGLCKLYPNFGPIFQQIISILEDWYPFNPEKKEALNAGAAPVFQLTSEEFVKCGAPTKKAQELRLTIGSKSIPNPNSSEERF